MEHEQRGTWAVDSFGLVGSSCLLPGGGLCGRADERMPGGSTNPQVNPVHVLILGLPYDSCQSTAVRVHRQQQLRICFRERKSCSVLWCVPIMHMIRCHVSLHSLLDKLELENSSSLFIGTVVYCWRY